MFKFISCHTVNPEIGVLNILIYKFADMEILCYIMIPILIMSMVLTLRDDDEDDKTKGDT